MCALQSKYTNKSKRLAVYLIVSLWGTASTRVQRPAAGGLHATAALMGEQGCAAPALPLGWGACCSAR